jgi:RNA recognition motif-containing protein
VGGLNYITNETKLAEVFKNCGEIIDIRMPLNE